MKKILVITVLALFLALPVIAVTDSDFTANGDVSVTLNLNGSDIGAEATLKIKTLSEARSLTASSTLDILNASSTSFQVYSDDSSVKAIKIATTTISCTVLAVDSAHAIAIASSSDAIATSTVTLIALSHALTYNGYCGAATCDEGWQVTGSTVNAICTACAVLTGAATYNSYCGAATCDTGYTLSGSGENATCDPPAGIISGGGGGGGSSQSACSTISYDEWQTTCVNNWQYRNVKSSSPSSCALTTAQQNDAKRQCVSTVPKTPGETPAMPATPASAQKQIENILADTATIISGKIENILAAVGSLRDDKAEASASSKYTTPLISGLKNVTTEIKTAITNFVNYGTPTTKILGAGERAGVISSYKAAFSKVPATEAEWSDVIKIGNGRWPSVKSATAESNATVEFKKVYKRAPSMSQPNDNAAVTVISYGLRPAQRNTNSEKAAIKSFKAIYGHAPVSAVAWDIVRAIAYSGAKR